MADKILVCKDCGKEFAFTEGEQDFYKEKGFTNEPKCCPDCRKARKAARFEKKSY
ncbi:MAG: zinc-ribbon domain-containing protein [Clostridiales bacterium]|nr:zinc-ribbon domain-containing protein [Clostridiales bacterium]